MDLINKLIDDQHRRDRKDYIDIEHEMENVNETVSEKTESIKVVEGATIPSPIADRISQTSNNSQIKYRYKQSEVYLSKEGAL